MHHSTAPFRIAEIRNFIPEKAKPWLLFCFFIIYQFSGGIYMAAVAEMSGSLALMHEDILMAGYASLVGLGLTFTIMLRLKFTFTTKASLAISASGLILCNLFAIHASSVPVLVVVSFVAGIFRMWGTFATNSTIQLWVTPKRDMAVWFVYIQVCVQSFIYLAGLTTIYISFLTKWEYMHWFIIGALLCLLLATLVCFNNNRTAPKLPLYGIDWMGALLWATTVISAIFVLNYGSHYDWYSSGYVWQGTVIGLAALVLNIWRASFIRHPYISNQTWLQPPVWITFLLFIIVEIAISPSLLFERMFTESILGYDTLTLISLNWLIVGGIMLGAFFAYRTFALQKWTFKTFGIIGFSLIEGYLLLMYFGIDYDIPKEGLYLPLLFRSAGYIILAITFITALTRVPFPYFWQSLTIQSFISASCGSLLGEAFIKEVFSHTMKKNFLAFSSAIDSVNPLIPKEKLASIFLITQQHAMMVSIKEIYGWISMFGIACILIFLANESSIRPLALQPKFSKLRRTLKHELKMDRINNR